MHFFLIISTIFGVLYVIQISLYIYGFLKLKAFHINKYNIKLENKTYLSVIIPFKNEEANLKTLIYNLKNQSLDKKHFEVLFINDNSVDNSKQTTGELIKGIENFRLFSLASEKTGKKNAVKEGIKHANTELIVTSDADCIHQSDWLKYLLYFYLENKPKMIIAPVLMTGKSIFQQFQSLEFLSLTGSTAGAAGISRPTMCNGANLAYRKDVFNEFKDALYSEEKSGDDVFLMHNIKKKYQKDIHYIKSGKAVVYTDAENSFLAFIKQRFRWASKSKSYFDFDAIFSSILVLTVNVVIVSFLILSIINNSNFVYLFSFLGIKMLIDFILLYYTADYYKQKKILFHFPIVNIIYPIYIVLAGVSGLFITKIRWKK